MEIGYRNLIVHILLVTRNDLNQSSNRKGEIYLRRQEALRFIYSDWFEALCLGINLEPTAVRERFLREMSNCKGRRKELRMI